MNYLRNIIVAIAAVLFSISAFADMNSGMGSWYVGGGIGRTYSHATSSNFLFPDGASPGPGVTSTGYGGKILLGSMYNSNLGVEFSYMQFAPVSVGDKLDSTFEGRIKTTALTLEGVGLLPVSKQLTFGLTAGGCLPRYKIDKTIMFAGFPPKKLVEFAYGAFGQFTISPAVSIRASWDQLMNKGGKLSNYKPENNMASADIVFSLGNA